jgi:hypothetical protein
MSFLESLIGGELPTPTTNNPQQFNQEPVDEPIVERIPSNKPSNQHNFKGNDPQANENDAIQKTMLSLGYGNNSEDESFFGTYQEEQNQNLKPQVRDALNQQPQVEQNQVSKEDAIINRFIRNSENPIDNLKDVDIKEISERLAQGDPSGFQEALQKTADNAMRNSVTLMLQMIPQIAASIEQKVKASVQTNLSEGNLWTEFTAKYPNFAPYKKMMADQLTQAVKFNKGNKNTAFQAMKQMYSGIADHQPEQRQEQQRTSRASAAFDLQSYLRT